MMLLESIFFVQHWQAFSLVQIPAEWGYTLALDINSLNLHLDRAAEKKKLITLVQEWNYAECVAHHE